MYGFVPLYDPPVALCTKASARSGTVSSFEWWCNEGLIVKLVKRHTCNRLLERTYLLVATETMYFKRALLLPPYQQSASSFNWKKKNISLQLPFIVLWRILFGIPFCGEKKIKNVFQVYKIAPLRLVLNSFRGSFFTFLCGGGREWS